MKIFIVLLFVFLSSPVLAKDFCTRFATGTSIECYTPTNPPPGGGGGITSVNAQNGSVGIGTFTTLNSGTNLTGTINNNVLTIDASGSLGSNYWQLSPGNIGINTTTKNVGIGTFNNGTARLVVTGGNVGFGTINPRQALEVVGRALFSGNVGIGTGNNVDGDKFAVYTTDSDTGSSSTFKTLSDTTTRAPVLQIQKATAANGNLSNGNTVGKISFQPRFNSSTNSVAELEGIYTGNGTTRTGDLRLLTSNAGAPGEVIRLTGAGNVGIGTTVPPNKLYVSGTAEVQGFKMNASATNGYVLTSDSSGTGTWQAASGGSSQWITRSGVGIGTYDAVGIGTIDPNGGKLIVLGGNIGVGTALPDSKLSITTSGGAVAHFNGGNSDTMPWISTVNGTTVAGSTFGWLAFNNAINGNLDWYRRAGSTTDNAVMSFQRADGNVGIGTNLPQAKVEVDGNLYVGNISTTSDAGQGVVVYTGNTTNASKGIDIIQSSGSWTPTSLLSLRLLSNAGGGYRAGLGYSTTSTFAENMTFNGAGNVGIGTFSPSYKLQVDGTSRFNGNLSMSAGTTASVDALITSQSASIGSSIFVTTTSYTGGNAQFASNIGIGTSQMSNSALTVMNGNVGIGTWKPEAILEVKGGNIKPSGVVIKRVTTVADATSITPNSNTTDIVYQANTQAAGTLTINADSGTPLNGQSMLFKLNCTNAQTFSWDSQFVGGTTALPTATTGSGKIDYYSFIYDTVDSKWQYTGTAGGF